MSILPINKPAQINFKDLDSGIAIVRGDIQGVDSIEKYGKNLTAAANDVVQDEEGTIAIETSATTIEIIGADADDVAAGAGAEAVRVFGVDANWNPIEETIITAGLSASLPSNNSYLYVYRAKIIDSGAIRNEGNLTIRRSSAGATLALILAGKGQTQKAMYPVFAGCSLYLERFRFEGSKTGSLTGEINLMEYELNEGIRVAHPIVFSSGAVITAEWDLGVKRFTEKTLVWVEIESISAGAVITASFDGAIVRHTDSTP